MINLFTKMKLNRKLSGKDNNYEKLFYFTIMKIVFLAYSDIRKYFMVKLSLSLFNNTGQKKFPGQNKNCACSGITLIIMALSVLYILSLFLIKAHIMTKQF